jgi:hypothetical protein
MNPGGEKMLRSLKELFGYTIRAMDGEIGNVHNFYFDDQSWTVRYLVVDTGGWLSGQRVLISPQALGHPEWEKKEFPVTLTQEQVEHAPHIDTDKPVSRQMEQELYGYYGWAPYWNTAAPLVTIPKFVDTDDKEVGDPHLRSVRTITGYHIKVTDGEIGHVDDFIASDEDWVIRYMIVDTRNWLPGKRVLVAPTWVDGVGWAERKVHVGLSRNTVKDSPEFDPSAPVNREYELRLYDYYGRPKYWAQV